MPSACLRVWVETTIIKGADELLKGRHKGEGRAHRVQERDSGRVRGLSNQPTNQSNNRDDTNVQQRGACDAGWLGSRAGG